MFQIMFTICLNYNTNVTCGYVASDRSLCVHGSNFVMYFVSFNCEKHDMSILKCITPYKKWLLKFMCKNVTEYSRILVLIITHIYIITISLYSIFWEKSHPNLGVPKQSCSPLQDLSYRPCTFYCILLHFYTWTLTTI
jgi:hypothetical protein